MDSLQIIAILAAIVAHFVFLYFVSDKFAKGWLRNLFARVKENEKGTDMGLMTVRLVVIIEAIIAFVIVKGF